MKCIIKHGEPQALIDWKSQSNDDWQPSYEDLRGNEKETVKQSLMIEQGFLCCYCERRLTIDDSHIEHFRPQNDPKCDALDYGNLLCSCQNKIPKGDPRHCGNLKNGWFDENSLVSPLSEGCEMRFAYTGDGRIRVADSADQNANLTIKTLGLNLRKLDDLRKHAISPFIDAELSDNEFREFVAGYLKLNHDIFGEFWTTIRHLFGTAG